MKSEPYLDLLKNDTFTNLLVSSKDDKNSFNKNYNGSLLFSFYDKPLKIKDMSIKVYNSFYITKSNIFEHNPDNETKNINHLTITIS